jgi:hypothetical protein
MEYSKILKVVSHIMGYNLNIKIEYRVKKEL